MIKPLSRPHWRRSHGQQYWIARYMKQWTGVTWNDAKKFEWKDIDNAIITLNTVNVDYGCGQLESVIISHGVS
jgi:hypothetical protein